MNYDYKKVKQVLIVILFANLFVAALKIIIGFIIKSTSLTADGFHSLADGSSNIAGLVGLHFASKPIDEEHPYGYRKSEMLAGLFIAGSLIILAGEIVIESVNKLFNPTIPMITLESLIGLCITLGINIFVCLYENRKGHQLKSTILISDSMHTKSDIFVSIGVFVTLFSIKIGLPAIIDPIASFVIVGFILHSAYEIFKDNSSILLDKAAVDSKELKSIAMSFEQVKDIHKIRSRGSIHDLYIDMHILTEPDLSVEESHELTHNIEKRIREHISESAQLIAHIEPITDEED